MPGKVVEEKPLDIAIVGGGITGVTLGLGLLNRNINFKIYERASSFGEIGAGIGFTPNAERAMKALDPRIHDAFRKVATQNSEDWFQWVDGYNYHRSDPNDKNEDLIFKLYLGERGFEGCRRSDFLDEVVRHIPKDRVVFEKNLNSVTERDDGGQLLSFRDGTTAKADVVVGCDGISSRVRRLMLGEDNSASYPSYSHKFAFRGLIPMDKARVALGEYKVSTRLMHLGPNAHALTFPVAMGSMLNVVAMVTDPNDWIAKEKTASANKNEAMEAFSAFGPAVRAIMSLLPDELDKWALFDTHDHPPPSYVQGGICIAGDAAHAAAPHHGAGAGCGVEDSLALATLMAAVNETIARGTGSDKGGIVRAALKSYNKVRYGRSQWLVDSSRVVGDLFEWRDPRCGSDPEKFGPEIKWRSHQIWDYDVDAMVVEALGQFSLNS